MAPGAAIHPSSLGNFGLGLGGTQALSSCTNVSSSHLAGAHQQPPAAPAGNMSFGSSMLQGNPMGSTADMSLAKMSVSQRLPDFGLTNPTSSAYSSSGSHGTSSLGPAPAVPGGLGSTSFSYLGGAFTAPAPSVSSVPSGMPASQGAPPAARPLFATSLTASAQPPLASSGPAAPPAPKEPHEWYGQLAPQHGTKAAGVAQEPAGGSQDEKVCVRVGLEEGVSTHES